MNDKLSKTTDQSSLINRRKIGSMSPLHQRLASSKAEGPPEEQALTFPNRLVLMLDCSGSMAEMVECNQNNPNPTRKIDHLKKAIEGFLTQCNWEDTAIAIETFPHTEYGFPVLSNQHFLHWNNVSQLTASGGTPMAEAMSVALERYSLTRGILVSDGIANNPAESLNKAREFKESGTPVDTVHIGDEQAGEELLQQIAEITGGMYIKFTDVSNFSKAFSFLAPSKRASLALMEKNEVAALLGAKEVR
jgi:uncharacterized protein YegL